jgi:hypothetical protein
VTEASVDVRLQVYPSGDWALRVGSSDYDLDHRGYFASASVPACNLGFDASDARTLARELRDEILSSIAENAPETDL